MAPPISVCERIVVLNHGGWVICIWIVYTWQGSVAVLQVAGSLLFRILLYYLIVVCFLSCCKNLTVTKSLPGSLCRPVNYVGHQRCTVYVYFSSGAMASCGAGGSQRRGDHSGVSFRCELQISWNASESYVNLESPGVVELDTSVVPDVLGLRALYEDAELTRVLPGRAQNSVRVLVPDARSKPRGFHDVTLVTVDMTNVSSPAVLMADMSHLW